MVAELWLSRVADTPPDSSPQGLARYREDVLAWLGAACELPADPSLCAEALAGRERVRVVVWLDDSRDCATVFSLREDALGPVERAALDALGSAYFEASFAADLEAHQYPGALLAMAWFGLSAGDEASLDVLYESVSDSAQGAGLDRAALHAALAAGPPVAADLDALIVRCYTLRLAR